MESRRRRGVLIALVILGIAGVAWWLSNDTAVTLAAPALFYAAVQFSDARHTINRLAGISSELSESTHRLEAQLSTHRIGVHPDFLPELCGLLKAAKHEVLVFCAFPAYVELSNPEGYSEYAKVIRRKTQLVSLICLEPTTRKDLIRAGFDRDGWENWRSAHTESMREFLNTHRSHALPETISESDFVDALSKGDDHALDSEFKGSKKWGTKLVMPLYFWVVDHNEAVFALVPFMKETEWEVAFRTRDEALIGALTGIFERYKLTGQQL